MTKRTWVSSETRAARKEEMIEKKVVKENQFSLTTKANQQE